MFMEMLFLGYVNELCIYLRLSFFKSVPLKTQNLQTDSELNKPVSFSHTNVLLIYVNETMYLLGHCLSSRFMLIVL